MVHIKDFCSDKSTVWASTENFDNIGVDVQWSYSHSYLLYGKIRLSDFQLNPKIPNQFWDSSWFRRLAVCQPKIFGYGIDVLRSRKPTPHRLYANGPINNRRHVESLVMGLGTTYKHSCRGNRRRRNARNNDQNAGTSWDNPKSEWWELNKGDTSAG